MWPAGYWPNSYWYSGYWPNGSAEAPEPTGGHFYESPAERSRRLQRERRTAEKQLQRFRDMSQQAVIDDLKAAIAEMTADPVSEVEQDAAEAIEEIVERFRLPQGIDLASLLLDVAQLQALVNQLARISVEVENRQDEDAVLLLLLHQ